MTDLLDSPAPVGDQTDAGCACGSGLRPTQCCLLDLRSPGLSGEEGAYADTLTRLGRLLRLGDRDAAYLEARTILNKSPAQREALGVLFNLLREDGNSGAAGALVSRLTALHPNDPVAAVAATQFFLARGDAARSQYHARMLVRLGPEAPVAHFLMGKVFLSQNNAPAAEHHFRRSLSLAEGIAEDARNETSQIEAYLAHALRKLGRLEEARVLFAGIEQRGALDLELLLNWAGLEEADRNYERANALLDRARALAPQDSRISAMKAIVLRRLKRPEESLAEASSLHADSRQTNALLEKGQTYDSMGRYDEAFACFDAFKRQLRERSKAEYRESEAASQVQRLAAFFTPGRSRLLPQASLRENHPQPVFIVGFPRSGTTLIEQTLTSHPQIAAGDELPIIDAISERTQSLLHSPVAYPRSLSELWFGDRASHVEMLRDLYLSEAALHGAIVPGKRWFTDKMPLNEVHLGLIHILFPKSPIVHLVRHPLDVVLSVFSNWLTHGFNCAVSLETAARHYALVADLLEHYKKALPLNFQALRYEDLVADQEAEVRTLFGFIGEAFDPAALSFHENPRYARTASYAQVTEKLYDRSVYRYRNYRRHLEPVIPILMPAIERLGYTVEG